MNSIDFRKLGVLGLRKLLITKQIKPSEILEITINKAQANKYLGFFSQEYFDEATIEAKKLDNISIEEQRSKPLFAIPHAIKDLNEEAGRPTFLGSKHGHYIPKKSDKLSQILSNAGGYSIAKTSTPEYGLYSYTEPKNQIITRNPLNPELGAGGSSGGAASAVASGTLSWAPGSDGGGSIRIPASCTGTIGFKPSKYFLKSDKNDSSLRGVVNGPIANNISDIKYLMQILCGQKPTENDNKTQRKPLKILATIDSSYSQTHDGAGCASYTLNAWEKGISILKNLGHEVTIMEKVFPTKQKFFFADMFQNYWKLITSSIEIKDDELVKLEPLSQELYLAGKSFSKNKAQEIMKQHYIYGVNLRHSLSDYDALLTPALSKTAPKIGYFNSTNLIENLKQQTEFTPYTAAFNVSGQPAITLPIDYYLDENNNKMPVSVQLVGRINADFELIDLAKQLEQVTIIGKN